MFCPYIGDFKKYSLYVHCMLLGHLRMLPRCLTYGSRPSHFQEHLNSEAPWLTNSTASLQGRSQQHFLKESMIVPITKSATKSSDPGNYRAISLPCLLCKVLEKHIIHGLMYEHLSNSQVLPDRSKVFNLVDPQLLLCYLWLRNGFLPLNVAKNYALYFFIYYRKAFDGVPHRPFVTEVGESWLWWVYLSLCYWLSNLLLQKCCGERAIFSVCPCYFRSTLALCAWSPSFLDYMNDLTGISLSDGAETIL